MWLGAADLLRPVLPGAFGATAPWPAATAMPTLTLSVTPAQSAASATPTSTIFTTPLPSATLTPTPTLTDVPTPAPPGELPYAPGIPEGVFSVLTRSGQAPLPVGQLRWSAAEPGAFLIKGYRLYRHKAGAEGWVRRPEPSSPEKLLALSVEDPVKVGEVYEYSVEAVDVKGRAGERSQPGRLDLSHLPMAQLAPPAPEGLTASSRRKEVQLKWSAAPAWVAPISSYRLFRADSREGLALSQPLELTATAFNDRPTEIAKDQVYAVASVDVEGRVSPLSVSAVGRATGTLPPGAPMGLTTRSRTEKVALAWQLALEGTAPISGYLLTRREESEENWKRVALLGPSATAYTDGAAGDKGYVYSLAAFDSEGNTGSASYVGASPTAKLWNKTLVVVMPTAYANNKDHDRGLNLNVLFDFYVGSLYESYSNPTTGQTRTGLFQPLQIGTVTTDTKWALLDDNGLVPGIAAGLYVSALINFGQPSGAQTVGVSSAGGGINTLGNAYAVVSKRFWPGEPRVAIHGGLLYGKLADYMTGDPSPKDWRPTLRHLMPGGDIPSLFTKFVDPKLGAQVGQSPHMVFAGLQVPFTVPLIFMRWRTGLRLEGMMPLPSDAEYPASALGKAPPAVAARDNLPWMLNIHVDNLPLFGFEFGVFQYNGGFQLIAFYHIPDLTWSW